MGLSLSSQTMDVGFGFGGSNYSGDLTPTTSSVLKGSSWTGLVQSRMSISSSISFKIQYQFLNVSADDRDGNQSYQSFRDLRFRSSIHELALLGQLDPLVLLTKTARRNQIYLTAGYGFFAFKPLAEFQGKTYSLRELGTEGQGLKGYPDFYSLKSHALIMGFGYRYILSSKWSIGFEYLTRKTQTDYLDDLSTNYVDYDILKEQRGIASAELGNKNKIQHKSQRANPLDRDWYNSLTIMMAYNFSKKKETLTPYKKRKKNVSCPKF